MVSTMISFNNYIILHSVISGAWNLNYFMTQVSMMSLSQSFQEASCCGVKQRNTSWKQSHENLGSVFLKIVLLWWKNLEIWKLQFHFEDRTRSHRSSYGDHALTSQKHFWLDLSQVPPFFSLYIQRFFVTMWGKKSSQTLFCISKLVQ